MHICRRRSWCLLKAPRNNGTVSEIHSFPHVRSFYFPSFSHICHDDCIFKAAWNTGIAGFTPAYQLLNRTARRQQAVCQRHWQPHTQRVGQTLCGWNHHDCSAVASQNAGRKGMRKNIYIEPSVFSRSLPSRTLFRFAEKRVKWLLA